MIGLDWENERYVRAYVRDNERYLLLPWQAQGLYWAIRRKADRAGLLSAENGAESIALIIRWPLDVVVEFLPDLLRRGFVDVTARGYRLPEYVASEEAKQSSSQRSRESRARRADIDASHDVGNERDAAVGERVEQAGSRVAGVTNRAAEGPERLQQVDSRGAVQRNDADLGRNVSETTLRAVPSVPTVPSERERRSRYESASAVFRFMEAERLALDPNARATAQIYCEDQITRLLGMGHTEDDLLHVVRVYAAEARVDTQKRRWFNSATMWQPDNVERAKSVTLPAAGASDDRGDGLRAGGSKPVRPADADERARARLAELDAEAEARRARGAR